jgi:hypothetical protein
LKASNVKTVVIHISTTQAVQAYLENLVNSGLFGKNVAEAAERLVGRGVEALIREGTLHRRKGGKGG